MIRGRFRTHYVYRRLVRSCCAHRTRPSELCLCFACFFFIACMSLFKIFSTTSKLCESLSYCFGKVTRRASLFRNSLSCARGFPRAVLHFIFAVSSECAPSQAPQFSCFEFFICCCARRLCVSPEEEGGGDFVHRGRAQSAQTKRTGCLVAKRTGPTSQR